MSTPVIEVRDVSAGYPGGPPVLDRVSLTVERGSRLVLLGANGSGKTTLLRCLCGSHVPASGSILVEGEPLGHDRRSLRAHRRRVQLVMQDPDDQLFSADVRQDVSFGPTNMGLPRDEVLARVDEALDLLSVTHLADRPCHQLSYGERKRVAIAGAVAMRPDVLLLDEPTAGLDPAGVRETVAILARLRDQGTTVVLATHDVDLALARGDRAAVVVDHQVVSGGVGEVLSDAGLVARARLDQPWPLALAQRLGLPGHPRGLDEVVGLLQAP
ncbi:ATP-binding cassette domain-containing protein [Brooklawnia cerclae]|uniref:ABC transporter ATP-binding protein n=1 Tax=Brooklawnia cerclae TaxID=349934 RepID=A0ABX0SK63_9ACTN|nr:cobalt/nickel transport system ATP-binding protein [Brooklawnia cerclae]